jgi:tRNA threonylcarbamoyladenosine biosynthesis protein TsaB
MKLLLIDTCGTTGTVALAEDTEILASATLPGRTASERLVPAIRSLAARANLSLPSLDAIAVVHGPGSFTGVRVGLSAAKGLCHALNLPLVAISRLAVLAHLAQTGVPHSSQSHRDGWGEHRDKWGQVHALLDAGRGEFYGGTYRNGVRLRESLLTRDRLLALLSLEPAPIIVACEPAVAESLGGKATPLLLAEPTAVDALPLALHRIRQRDFDDLATLDANYLRRTDAEIFAKPRAPAHAAASETPAKARKE